MRITKPTYIVPEGREEPYDLEEREFKGARSYEIRRQREERRKERQKESAKNGKTYIDLTEKQFKKILYVPFDGPNIHEVFDFKPENDTLLFKKAKDRTEYQKLYHQQWYAKNKEKYNEQRRKKYAEYEEFRERKKAKAKENYYRNKKYKQRRDEMTEEQLQARRARHREYYKKNKDKIEAQKKLHDYNIGQYLWDKKWGSKDFNLGRAADLKEVYKKLINNTYKVGGTVHRTNNRVLSFYIEDGETKYYLLCDGQLKERDEAVYKYDLATYKDFFPGEGRELENQDELINLIKFNAYIKNKKKEEF